MRAIKIFALLIGLCHSVNSFEIIISKSELKIHSTKNISHFWATLKAAKKTAKVLTTKEPLLDKSAQICKDSTLNSIDFAEKAKNSTLGIHSRVKRGIKPLGELWAWITDTPGPGQWAREQELLANLVAISKDEHTELSLLRGAIKVENSLMADVDSKADTALKFEEYNKNNIELVADTILAITNFDAFCSFGFSLIKLLNQEVQIVRDIMHYAESYRPSKHMFPTEKIQEIINKHLKSDKINRAIFESPNEIDEIYRTKSALT
jgi:hypothetical protein